ncbi:MAG: LPS export ABC transporter ATP-binding protein [Planctomycetaceae bacterium]|jgi:lipopolysaccharide export system ATP-binding protein|nr:LPS export ABC transporter ATP-binding protein [Planctomycetaceae bacterium]
MKTDAAPQQTILEVKGLIKIYGKRTVVDGVSFHINRGEIVGLLGPNGAGKTTSFRMACGLIPTNGGIVYLGSQDVTKWPMYKRSKDGGMGYLPQDKSVFQRLTVENNLLGVMEMLGMKRTERKTRCEELLEKFRLTHLRHNYGGGLSGGERRRLEIARSLVSKPKIILLDEPFAAIDPVTVASIQEIIRQLAGEGISILVTDHSVQDTLEITQRSYVIQAGKVLCQGTPSEVLANPEARKVYFGEKLNGKGQPVSDTFREVPHRIHSGHKPHHQPGGHIGTGQIDSQWEVPPTKIKPAEVKERQESAAAIQPFHLKIGTKTGNTTDAAAPESNVAQKQAAQASVLQESISQEHNAAADTKRLKRSFQTITMPAHSRDASLLEAGVGGEKEPPEEQDEASLSTIIRNLGQVIGFNR